MTDDSDYVTVASETSRSKGRAASGTDDYLDVETVTREQRFQWDTVDPGYTAPSDIKPPQAAGDKSGFDFPSELAGWLVVERPSRTPTLAWCHLREGVLGSFSVFTEPSARSELTRIPISQIKKPLLRDNRVVIGELTLIADSVVFAQAWHDVLQKAALHAALTNLTTAESTKKRPGRLTLPNDEPVAAPIPASAPPRLREQAFTFDDHEDEEEESDYHYRVDVDMCVIPANFRNDRPWWFKPEMSRDAAESLLRVWGMRPGTFVVRRSTKPAGPDTENYVLTLCTRTEIAHSVLEHHISSGTFTPSLHGRAIEFKTLEEVVHYFRRQPLADGTKLVTKLPQ